MIATATSLSPLYSSPAASRRSPDLMVVAGFIPSTVISSHKSMKRETLERIQGVEGIVVSTELGKDGLAAVTCMR